MATLQLVKNPNLVTATALGLAYEPTLDAPGGLQSQDDSDGPYLSHLTAAQIASSGGVISSFDVVQWQGLADVTFEVKLYPSDLPPTLAWGIWIGLFSQHPTSLDDPPSTAEYAAFRVALATGAMESVTRKVAPGGIEIQSLGAVSNLLNKHSFKIERLAATGDVKFTWTGPATPQSTTHTDASKYPSATTEMGYGIRVFATTSAARSIRWKLVTINVK